MFIYCFGGFDKRAIDIIERIKLKFSQDPDETLNGSRPIISSKWEKIKDASLEKSVECCGTYQISEREIIIFGGFQNGECKNTQLFVFNTHTYSFAGALSHLKFTDCFQLAPYHKNSSITQGHDPLSKNIMKDNGTLYAWSIYDNLHVLDMNTYQWDVIACDKTGEQDFQPQNI